MIKFARIASIVFAVAVATPASAEVFGVQMGTPPQSLGGKLASDDPGPVRLYGLPRVPKPHQEFESYGALSSSKTGICKIMGYGRSYEGDIDGAAVREAMDKLSAALEAKYGKPLRADDLKEGSIWNKPEDYAMSLRQQERKLLAFWVPKSGATLPPDLQGIKLEGSALSSSETFLIISYQFANFAECEALMRQANNEAL